MLNSGNNGGVECNPLTAQEREEIKQQLKLLRSELDKMVSDWWLEWEALKLRYEDGCSLCEAELFHDTHKSHNGGGLEISPATPQEELEQHLRRFSEKFERQASEQWLEWEGENLQPENWCPFCKASMHHEIHVSHDGSRIKVRYRPEESDV